MKGRNTTYPVSARSLYSEVDLHAQTPKHNNINTKRSPPIPPQTRKKMDILSNQHVGESPSNNMNSIQLTINDKKNN